MPAPGRCAEDPHASTDRRSTAPMRLATATWREVMAQRESACDRGLRPTCMTSSGGAPWSFVGPSRSPRHAAGSTGRAPVRGQVHAPRQPARAGPALCNRNAGWSWTWSGRWRAKASAAFRIGEHGGGRWSLCAPRGCNRWQPAANLWAARTPETSTPGATGCDQRHHFVGAEASPTGGASSTQEQQRRQLSSTLCGASASVSRRASTSNQRT